MPRLNNKPHKVCLSCYDRLTKEQLAGGSSSSSSNTATTTASAAGVVDVVDRPSVLLTPDDILKISANDDEPSSSILQPESADDAIRTRLQRLKEARAADAASSKPPAAAQSDRDIAIRIANLKDQHYIDESAGRGDASILLNTDRRTDQEKMNDLLEQFAAEVKLDQDADPIRDIERRLAALRAGNSEGAASERTGVVQQQQGAAEELDDDENDADHAKRLVERYMAEAALEDVADERELELTAEEQDFVAHSAAKADQQKKASAETGGGNNNADEEELPWCVICNEDAALRYQGDLFCRSCYKEVLKDDVDE